MTTITIDRAVAEQALHVAENAGYPLALIKALKAALAQEQAEPVALTHRHEWFRTGGMEQGQFRCIHCGAWVREKSDD